MISAHVIRIKDKIIFDLSYIMEHKYQYTFLDDTKIRN